jgi:DNA (cytosine-5)-methyltransferase 1
VDTHTFNILSLCSGGGGLDNGVKLAVPDARTVCYVEIEAYCCEVLASQMEKGTLDAAPIWTDLKTFDGKPWRGVVDCIIGGYPCQPFSVAGKRQGSDDPRHLWPHIARIIREVQPLSCFFENVAGHLTLGFSDVVRELGEMGYRTAAGLFTAAEVGASHKRERLFILADHQDNDGGIYKRRGREGAGAVISGRGSCNMENSLGGTSGQKRLPESGETLSRRAYSGPTGPSGILEYSDILRLEGCKCQYKLSGEVGSNTSSEGKGVELFAYGPKDPRWETLLVRNPELRPALSQTETQSIFRGMADGMEDRIDRLRILGNGVVPEQARYAYNFLSEELRNSA